MAYVVTIVERTPTEDGTDINVYHRTFIQPLAASQFVEDYFLNWGCLVTLTISFVKDDEPQAEPLPIHRTEAGYPRCSTCDGGGCPDCTDPA